MKKSILIIVLVLSTLTLVTSLEVREGRIKLVIHESTGRFSLYYLIDLAKDTYEPLFVVQDPRTTFLALLIDDRVYKMGESSSFRSRIEREDNKIIQVFESPSVQVMQEFSFIKTKSANLADGISLRFRIINRGDKDIALGVKFLLDTYLGEKTASPFSTNLRSINNETLIQQSDTGDLFWYTGDVTLGFMGNIVTPNTTLPDSLHFANWKRLNDASWTIQYSPGRNFNMLPYSISDSAVCYYYATQNLARGLERDIDLVLAVYNPSGFETLKTKSDNLDRLLQTSIKAADDPELAMRTDLITIRDYLIQLDNAIVSGGIISDDELLTLETILDRIKERNMKP